MVANLLLALSLYGLGFGLFGRFEHGVAPERRALRGILYLGLVAVVTRVAGPTWGRRWALGQLALGALFHFGWCLKNGINPLTAEPRDKYNRLRGWE